ncbi:right-handed parallel beta-helix repeat-containing protein [Clostridium estertheticum]|uniref:pectate lyase family protein n=1 Tax=Clostridium estertheticum TaxID=238834 RepID=UPI001C0B22E0|nr:right-handed parallel beta-helix repeat-containing protein [Clostridium estertheticum]MBU3215040.1 right-handed parallel beta-helix repeat-containing protein [Clostridium estertheticum]WAG55669.1 right-handed parallel beta-helix repeat-containing protein [Clostridium estertheticum]
MVKKPLTSDQVKKISKQIMLAVLASSVVMTTCLSASASTYNLNSVSLENTQSVGNTVSILESNGWLESANVEWAEAKGATGYNVYCKLASATDSEYKQLDNQLIRKYSSYFRADVLGLSQGNYVMKIVPTINNKEASLEQVITKTIKVKANTREGFAFASGSPMGTGSGGYKDDGTVASNAQIVYITASNVNKVTANVITNIKGTETLCTGITDILAKRQKGYDKRPLIIRMVGEIKAADITGLNSTGYLQLKGCYNVTFEGVGEDATAYGWGVLIRDSHNVELRNMGVMLFPDDGISLDTGNENIWVHNNDIFYGAAGSDADQVKGDGSCDVKKSTYVTVAYNHFYDSGKCSLCGMSDTENFYVTYHHNWFDHSDSRQPRIRVGTIHIYNNYFDGNSKYGVGVTKGASAFVEDNYFRNCKYPMLSSLQGSDISGGSVGTFSGEAGGMIKAYNNKVEGATTVVYSKDNATQFDAYLASARNEQVPSTYKSVSGGNMYNNFDTSSLMYKYVPDARENVESNVTTYAGRVDGGDFKWNFTDADDVKSEVNTELMTKIKSYKSDLVSVGGNSVSETAASVNATTILSSGDKVTTSGLVLKTDANIANAIYTSPSGTTTGTGTQESPMSLETAIATVKAGGTILLMNGTYSYSKQLTIPVGNNGTANAYKTIKPCQGANVTLDFSSQPYNMIDTSLNARGLQMEGNYWHVYGIRVTGAADNGIFLCGNNNIVEYCVLEANRDSGLQISRRSSNLATMDLWPTNNQIINSTSFNNSDPKTGENADGFGAKLTCGEGNVFDGCISYNNVDDGWDLFSKSETGPIGAVTIKNCIAFRNGQTTAGKYTKNSDGNGFKLGGSGIAGDHSVINCISFENKNHGFTDNSNPGTITVKNCTSFNNSQADGKKSNFDFARTSASHNIFENLISFSNTKISSDKYIGVATNCSFQNGGKYFLIKDKQNVYSSNLATRGTLNSAGVSAADFVSITSPALGANVHKLWRNADETVNTQGLLMMANSSQYKTMGAVFGASK